MNQSISAESERITNFVKANRWIAVLRTDNESSAIWAATSAINAGVPVLELTFSIPNVARIIKELKKSYPEQVIGLGTITNQAEAKVAHDSPADFLVSPHLDEGLIKILSNKLYIPGVFTPSEIIKAQHLGARWCKIFPVNVYGPSGLKTLLGPMPRGTSMSYVVTGGVTESNSKEYLKAGAAAVGVGSNIFSDQALASRDEHHIISSVKAWRQSLAQNTN